MFGPADYTLIVRLRISEDGASTLDQSAAETSSTAVPVDKKVIPDWLGGHRHLFAPDSMKGRSEARQPVYTADLFYRSPYLNGVLLRPERRTLILVLYTM